MNDFLVPIKDFDTKYISINTIIEFLDNLTSKGIDLSDVSVRCIGTCYDEGKCNSEFDITVKSFYMFKTCDSIVFTDSIDYYKCLDDDDYVECYGGIIDNCQNLYDFIKVIISNNNKLNFISLEMIYMNIGTMDYDSDSKILTFVSDYEFED